MTEAQTAAPAPAALAQYMHLPVTSIHRSPTNPRKSFPEGPLAELTENVRKHGVMQPILVRPWNPATKFTGSVKPTYEIVAGERRYRAASAAGLETIPAMLRDLTDREVIVMQMIENLQREDLNALDEAQGYKLMMDDYGYSVDELAEDVGKSKGKKTSKAYIYARLKLLALSSAPRKLLADDAIDASTALLIARIPVEKLQVEAAKEIIDQAMSHRRAAEYIQQRFMLKLSDAPFPTTDAALVAKAGACDACPKRTGANPDLFSDVKSADVCTDTECFSVKKVAWVKKREAEVRAKGHTVITGEEAEEVMQYGYVRGGFVAVNENSYDHGNRKPAEILKQAARAGVEVKTSFVHNKRDGTLVEVIEGKQLKAAMTRAGLTKKESAGSDKFKVEQKKREAGARQETQFRKRLHAQLHAAIATSLECGGQPARADLQMVAESLWNGTGFDTQKLVTDVWIPAADDVPTKGKKPKKVNAVDVAHKQIHALSDQIKTMTPNDLCLFMIDVSLLGQCHASPFNATTTPAELTDAADRWGVSVKDLRAALKTEADAKVKKSPAVKKPIVAKVAKTAKAKAAVPDAQKKTPTPAKAAQAKKSGAPVKAKKIADVGNAMEAAGKAASAVANAWPFPTPEQRAENAKAAQAPELNAADPAAPAKKTKPAKTQVKAAGAAKDTKAKASKSGRAAAVENKQTTETPTTDDDAIVERCANTVDLFEPGQTSAEGGAA